MAAAPMRSQSQLLSGKSSGTLKVSESRLKELNDPWKFDRDEWVNSPRSNKKASQQAHVANPEPQGKLLKPAVEDKMQKIINKKDSKNERNRK